MRQLYFEYWKLPSGRFNFRYCSAGNNENLMATRQGYENLDDAKATMELIHEGKPYPIDIREVDAP